MKKFILLFILFPTICFAQSISIGLDSLSGVHDSKSAVIEAEYGSENFDTLTRFRYKKFDNSEIEDKAFLRIGWDPRIKKDWSLWFFEKMSYDHAKKIDFENFIGAGPKYSFHNSSISVGYLQHHQEMENITQDTGRFSLRLKSKSSNNKIGIIILYQPNSADLSDYIVDSELFFRYSINDTFAIKFLAEDQYRSTFEEKNELILSLFFEFKFGKKQ